MSGRSVVARLGLALLPAAALVGVLATPLAFDQRVAERIIPGQSIGPFRLGMRPGQIARLLPTVVCQVEAEYAGGRAAALMTEWGGACQTDEGLQVGGPPEFVRRVYGDPTSEALDRDYEKAFAWWMVYESHGIAFRVLISESGGFIQAVRVFLPKDGAPPK